MNELAGGFYRGDRVLCDGRPGMIFGKPARAACVRISVSVMYDDGTIQDERVAKLQLLEDEETEEQEAFEPEVDGAPPEPPEEVEEEPEDLDTTQIQPGRVAPKIEGIGRQVRLSQEEPEPSRASATAFMAAEDARRNLFEVEDKVDEMADKVLEKIRRNYTNLRTAFRALDRSNNGYISRADFLDALEHIFINSGCTPEEVEEIAARFGFGPASSETLSYEEFCHVAQAIEEDPYEETMHDVEVVHEDRSDRQRIEEVQLAVQSFRQICERRYASLRESFRALDKGRRSSLSPEEFAYGLSMHGVNLKPDQMQDAWDIFDPKGTGQISYADFCRVMSQRMTFGNHLSRQMYK